MNDPVDEICRTGTGTAWRLGQFEGRGAKALDGPIVFELIDTNGSILAAVSMPLEKVEELLRPQLSIFAELQLDGSVLLDSELFALFPPAAAADILELVKQALAPEMLEDEPNLREQLYELRRKLTDSLTLVDKTLADLGNPET